MSVACSNDVFLIYLGDLIRGNFLAGSLKVVDGNLKFALSLS